ncbi:hypothetical protein COCC4DRAFT_181904 [Bipolaris maydis ATCC 48331]|uniref:BZIP domain-containing protein n=1 Tax=Cochliobolus heterostrophus (strain C4 / ATCC 48331 / race T) TaxID=665024 RepID=N4WSC4_COCH4|nr:uncharacterized protein COCC4DRAFT_181904 [Bipolaris maydis ATCC 48331]ENH99087.1 hypothetical protein COCC4DRAFT_181904 [Bipolaris maydis ATCC 48331]KAJ6273092.1 hypothetical protein PSV08DRAFT_220011 [Bipolaris maydis]
MQLTTTQLAQRRERNRKSQRRSRQKVKDEIDTLKRQNKDLELNNVSLQERLRHALAAIDVLENGASLQ